MGAILPAGLYLPENLPGPFRVGQNCVGCPRTDQEIAAELLDTAPSLHSEPTRQRMPRPRSGLPGLVFGVGVGLLLSLGTGPQGFLVPRPTFCQLGAEVGTYVVWTPVMLINIPDGGNVSWSLNHWNLTTTSGSLTLGPPPPPPGSPRYSSESGGSGLNRAGVWAEYQDHNWTVFHVRNESGWNGGSVPCTQPYVASAGYGLGCGGEVVIPLANNTTDVGEMTVWNGTPGFNGSQNYPGCPVATSGSYVSFSNGFPSGATGRTDSITIDLCNQSGYERLPLYAPAIVSVSLTVPADGGDISVAGLLEFADLSTQPLYSGPSVSYLIPAGYSWTIAPIGPVATAAGFGLVLPGLVAFERSSC